MNKSDAPPFYGFMAEFEKPEELLEAAEATYKAGYRKLDAYSPVPIHGLAAAIGFARTNLPIISFIFGALGLIAGYGLQYWVHVIDYPINIGGRPHHSGLYFIPVAYELTILFAAFATGIGMFALNGLPQPYHPVFNVENFARASQDRFFLCVEAEDPIFDGEKTRSFLESLNPQEVAQVEH